MQIELFSFSKRKNSTKKPQGAGSVVSCALKEETSVLFPSFELVTNPTAYNYVKAFGFYYYVTDCTYVRNNLWRISCRIDELATWSDTIKATRAYIEYTDTYNSRVYDPRLAKLINATETSTSVAAPYVDTTGYYVTTIIGEDTCGIFKMNISEVESLMQNATQWWNNFDTSSWGSVEDSIKNLGRLFITGNPAENIKACRFIAAPAPSAPSTHGNIHAGFYDLGMGGHGFGFNRTVDGTVPITVPHPSNVMLRTSQTCEYSLFLPYIGNVTLSSDILADESSISINYSVHSASGDLALTLKTGSGKYIGSYGGNLGCDVPIGSSGIGIRTLATAAVTAGVGLATAGAGMASAAAAGAAETGAYAAAATKAVSSTAAGLFSIQGTPSCVGGLGSCASIALSPNITLTCSYWDVSDVGSNLTSLIGNPYYKVDTIGNHGFVRCSGASVDIAGYDEVTNAINSYLQGGVYIE